MNAHTFAPEIIPFILNLVEQSEDVFWIRSPDYSQQIYISPAYETIWGRKAENLYQHPEEWLQTIHPEDLIHLQDSVKKRNPNYQPGQSFNETYRIIRPDGEIRWINDKSVPIHDDAGNHIGFAGIAQDVTAAKETEQLRIQNKVLEEQEETTKLLAASIAHELRTPLRAIESGAHGIEKFLPILLEGYKKAKDAGLEVPFIAPLHIKSLAKIAHNTEVETRAAFSVIDMLLVNANASQINTSKFTTCSIADCVRTALTRYPFRSDETHLIHLKKGDFSFHGDEMLMIHILFNLLKNALYYIKAANKGDIYIWCDQNEQFNLLHFKDTSQGIDPAILPRIFEKFFTKTQHGTGVGLAFSKLVMQSFGGDIACDSVKGEYTDFTLSFPRIQIK